MIKGRMFYILKRIIIMLNVMASACMVGILAWISSYSVFVADDFSLGIIKKIGDKSYFWGNLLEAFSNVKQFYYEWQGTYFQVFLQSMTNPVNGAGLSRLRYLMAANTVMFFLALVLLIIVFMKKSKGIDTILVSIIVTLAVFSICGYETYPEVFFWYSGAMGYSVPMSLLMLGLVFFILDRGTVAAALLGFLSMGGSLTVSGTGCYVALLFVLYNTIKYKRMPLKKVVVFLIWLSGALINALAPGNYVRHSIIDDTGLHLLDSINYAVLIVIDRYITLFSYNYIFVLIIVVGLGIIAGKKDNVVNNYVLKVSFSILGLITPIVSAFPVTLGTGTMIPPNRCAFIIDLAIIMSSFFFTYIMGFAIGRICEYRAKIIAIALILVLELVYCKYDGYGLNNFKTYELFCQQFFYDVYSDHYYAHVNFYNWVKNQKGCDVVVTPDHCPYGIDNVHNLYLFSNPDEWVNKCVAKYCGVKSIRTDYD